MQGERALVLVLFFLSGASGLVYEVVWTRQLGLLFGVSVFSASAVLAAFMGGLGLGSFLFGRLISTRAKPIRAYAWLEAGIGLSALAVGPVLAAAEPLYVALARSLEGHFLVFNLARALLAAAILLIPTTLMGATVPAIAGFLVTRRERVGGSTALLYASNTLGALLGCIAAGFVLVPALGISTTVYGAAAVNLGIAVVILVGRVGASAEPSPPGALESAPVATPAARVATAVFALSGFAALGFEVLWTRALIVHVHNTHYAFAVMLAAFLAGLALGDALLVRVYDRIRRPLVWLGVAQLGVAASILVAAAAYSSLRTLGTELLGAPSSWAAAVSLVSLRAGLVLLPSTLILGTTFPLVARIVCGDLRRVSRDLGRAYAANTWGAVLGSLATAFLLIPILGLRDSLAALSGLCALLGGVCLVASADSPRWRAILATTCALAAALPALAIPRSLFTDAYETDVWKLIYYREGITDSTGVYEHVDTKWRFVTYGDQRGTAGTFTASVGKREGHLGHLLHPNPRRSLQIGFGVGNTLAAAALHPEVEQLDCVELSPHVRDTAPYFWTNDGVLGNPKVRLIVDDGRNFLLRTRDRYEVIGLDPPEIFTADVVNLYTREFYELASRALADDGLLFNWLPTYAMGERELRMLVRSVLEVFPGTTLWLQGPSNELGEPLTNMLVIVGSRRPLRLDVERLERRMSQPPLRSELEQIGIATPDALIALYLAGPERLWSWVESVPPVIDDHTRVDFSSPKLAQAGYGFGVLRVFEPFEGTQLAGRLHLLEMQRLFQRLRQPSAPLLDGSPDSARIVARVEEHRRRHDSAVERLERALSASPAAAARASEEASGTPLRP